MAQKAHGKAQTQEEAQANTLAASKDWALDLGGISYAILDW
jgi:hypothetical protein